MEILFLTLPIENLLWLMGIKAKFQNFPLFIVLVGILFWLLIHRIEFGMIGKFFLALFLYSNILVCLNGFFEEINYNNLLRINTSYLAGFLSFLFLKFLFANYDIKKIDKYIFLSYITVFIVGIWQFIRREFRLYSTFTEPKHLGLFLILVYLFWFELRKKYYSLKKRIAIKIIFFFLLIATFSTTAYLVFMIYLLISSFIHRNKREKYIYIFIISLFFVLFVYLMSFENYFAIMIKSTLKAGVNLRNQTGTFIDNFSIILFYKNLHKVDNIKNLIRFFLGSGIGQERFYFEIVGKYYFNKISSMKVPGSSLIPSLLGKFQSYMGVLGIIFFVSFNINLIRTTIQNSELEDDEKRIIVKFLLVLLIIPIFSLGTFQGIENWFVYSYVEYKLSDRIQYLGCSIQITT